MFKDKDIRGKGDMKKKALIYLVAVMMFASSWVGVFATENVSGEEGQAVDQSQQIDQEEPSDQELEPLVDEEATEPTEEEVQTEEPSETEATVETEPSTEATEEATADTLDVLKNTGDSKFTLKATNTNISQIAIAWSENNNLTAKATYFVEVPEINYKSKTITAKTWKLGGLKAGQKYTIKVTATDNGITYTEEISFSTVPKIKLETLSGYKQIKVQWSPVVAGGTKITNYEAYIGSASNPTNLTKNIKYDKASGKYFFINKGAKARAKTKYTYRVRAIEKAIDSDGNSYSVPVDFNYTKPDSAVSPMYITIKLKRNRTFTSLDKPKRKLHLKKNTTIESNGYGGGCYYFTWGGRKYRVSRVSTKKAKASYVYEKEKRGKMIKSAWNYSPAEAEFFVEGYMAKNGKSGKKYAIWVSFYTQRMYILENQGGNKWKCINNWNCATGKASTPSPTGKKAIGKKKRSHHGIGWWSSFSSMKSIANSIHGNTGKWILGNPQSHGCIRNMPKNAKWVYKNVSYGSRVINY